MANKLLTRKPEVSLNHECSEIVNRAFSEYKDEYPLFKRHWIFENAIAEAYQLGISKEQKRHLEDRPISKKEVCSFLYQANLKHIKSLMEHEVSINGINITTPKFNNEPESRYVYLIEPSEIQKEIDENNETLMCRWKTDNRWEKYNSKTHFGENWQYDWRIVK